MPLRKIPRKLRQKKEKANDKVQRKSLQKEEVL